MFKKLASFGSLAGLILIVIIIIAKVNDSITFDKALGKAPQNEPRIVSFSPSITEYIYALGLDKYLIANTTYCNYPPDAKNKQKVGDFLNINYEHLISMGINTAIVQQGMEKQRDDLTMLGINVIMIDNSNVENILNAFNILGEAFQIKEYALKERKKIEEEIEMMTSKISWSEANPRVLISIFRDYTSEKITNFTAAGKNNLYNDILSLLGAQNVLDTNAAYPEISREGLIASNPDIIIDITHNNKTVGNVINAWLEFTSINAVQNNRIYAFPEVMVSIPGPRIAEIIRLFYSSIYDEL